MRVHVQDVDRWAPLALPGMLLMLGASFACPAHADAPAFPDSTVRSWQTGLLRADRLEHASLAFSSGLAFGVVTRRPAAAAAGAITLGFAKEIYDRRRTSFDRGDLLADAVGAALSALVTHSLGR